MCTSQAGIGHFMYTSLGLDWSFDVLPHMLFILHSRATKRKGGGKKKEGYSCRCTDEIKGGLRSAGSDMNEDVQHSSAYGDGGNRLAKTSLAPHHALDRPCVMCTSVLWEGEGIKAGSDSTVCLFFSCWRRKRKDVLNNKQRGASIGAYRELPSHMWWQTSSPVIHRWLSLSLRHSRQFAAILIWTVESGNHTGAPASVQPDPLLFWSDPLTLAPN